MRQYQTRSPPCKIPPLFSSVKVGFSLSSTKRTSTEQKASMQCRFQSAGDRVVEEPQQPLGQFISCNCRLPKNSLSSFLQSTKIVEIFVKLLTIHISSLMNHSLPRLNKCVSLECSLVQQLFYMHSQQGRETRVIKKYLSVVFQRELFKMYVVNILISGLQLNFVVSFKLEKH